MSEVEQRVRQYLEEMWNRRDLSVFDRFVAKDVRYHPPRGAPKDYEGYRQMAEGFFRSFPDLSFEIEGLITQGDLASARLRIRGTQDGEWRGHAPTGGRIDVAGRPWFRLREGKVVEIWSLWDEAHALEQLGLLKA